MNKREKSWRKSQNSKYNFEESYKNSKYNFEESHKSGKYNFEESHKSGKYNFEESDKSSKYNFEEKLQKDNYKEINTAIYTMMGLRIIYYTFEKLDINIDKYLNLEEAADLIIKNIKENVLT